MVTIKAKKAVVIGASLAGLSTAFYLAKAGWQVDIFESSDAIGGRYQLQELDDFESSLDNNWYWLPDVWQNLATDFNQTSIKFLPSNPNYQIFFSHGEFNVGRRQEARELFGHLEPGAGIELEKLLTKAEKDYQNAVYPKNRRLAKLSLIADKFKGSYEKLTKQFVHDRRLKQFLNFKTIFLGTSAKQTNTEYNFLNWIDYSLGLPQPVGGWPEVHKFLVQTAEEEKIKINFGKKVTHINTKDNKVTGLRLKKKLVAADLVITTGNYQKAEELLPVSSRQFQAGDYAKLSFAPRSVVWAFALDISANNLSRRNVFLDGDWSDYLDSTFSYKRAVKAPEQPLFIIEKITDKNGEKDLLLVTLLVANSLELGDENQESLKEQILTRISGRLQFDVKKHITSSQTYELNSPGLAPTRRLFGTNTLPQKSTKVEGLYFVGPDTGSGLLPSQQILAGKLAASTIIDAV